MTSRARLLATVLLLAPVAAACGTEQQAPVVNRPASPAPGVAATGAAAVASPSAATTTTPPQPPAPPAAVTSVPPPPTAQAEKPAATQSAAPLSPAAERPPGKVTLPARLGAVTFDHEKHAGELNVACTTCHHASRPQTPVASEKRACRDCHTMPATQPMKTSLQAAFHDPRGGAGTCIDCHKQKGGSAPVKCLECHKQK